MPAMLRRAVLGVLLASGIVGGAVAAELAGSALTIGRKTVPLPNAAWTIVAEREQGVHSAVKARAALLDGVVAVAGEGPAVRLLVLVRTNRAPTPGGFGIAEACRRTDLHDARMESRSGSAVAACTFIAHVLQGAPADGDRAWADAMAALERAGRVLPTTWLVVGIRIVDDGDLLDVRYYFNPTEIGFPDDVPTQWMAPPAAPSWLAMARASVSDLLGRTPEPGDPRWAASGWSAAALQGDERRSDVVRSLEAWAAATQPAVYTGFKGWAVAGVPPPTAWTGHRTAAAAVADGLPGDTALWKTLSWRAIGSALDAVISYLFTGSLGAAGGITVVGGFVNATVYYLHEKAWEVLGVERSPGDLVTELRPAGIER